MARKRKKVSFDSVFNARFLNGLFLFLAVSNVAVIFLFESTRTPRVERHEVTLITNHVFIVTNNLVSSDVAASSFDFNSTNVIEHSISYNFFVHNGQPAASFYGRYFSQGSPTSYGRVVQVFPDRILLDNGHVLVNQIKPIEEIQQQELLTIRNRDVQELLKDRYSEKSEPLTVPHRPNVYWGSLYD